MKIGLCDVDSIKPNLALMKLSAWHKRNGDECLFWSPLWSVDRIYASKVFTFTLDDPYLPESAIRGGTGYGSPLTLSDEQEHIMPDYQMFNCDHAMGFVTRGCHRKCPWCVVPQKEGKIHQHALPSEFIPPDMKEVVFLDNNILAMPEVFFSTAEWCTINRVKADWNQALDIRLVTDDIATALKQTPRRAMWRFSFDSKRHEAPFRRGIERMFAAGHRADTLCVFLLGSEHEGIKSLIERCQIAWGEYGVHVFVMLWRPVDGSKWSPPNWHDFAAIRLWANNWNNKRVRNVSVIKTLASKYDIDWTANAQISGGKSAEADCWANNGGDK